MDLFSFNKGFQNASLLYIHLNNPLCNMGQAQLWPRSIAEMERTQFSLACVFVWNEHDSSFMKHQLIRNIRNGALLILNFHLYCWPVVRNAWIFSLSFVGRESPPPKSHIHWRRLGRGGPGPLCFLLGNASLSFTVENYDT